jgi:hypothetical protein
VVKHIIFACLFQKGSSYLSQYSHNFDRMHRRWDTRVSNDGGVMNDATMRAFYARVLTTTPIMTPISFTLSVFNPGTSDGRGGIKVMSVDPYLHLAFLHASTVCLEGTHCDGFDLS